MRLVKTGCLQGTTYGNSSYKLYEACSPGQENQAPLLLLWLHGADMGDIPPSDLAKMHNRLCRRTFFLVPLSPRIAASGLRFCWGISYTKQQNRNALGFVHGELHEPFLADLGDLVRKFTIEVGAERVYAFGYSMGGFGVYLIAGYAPHLFDVAVIVAGYGRGTQEPSDRSYRAPQPFASEVFNGFLDRTAHHLARVPAVIVVHAPLDIESSFNDARVIVGRIIAEGGNAWLEQVPDTMAESDPRSKKSNRIYHRYFNYTLISDTSVEVLYNRIEDMLARNGKWQKQVPEIGCQLITPDIHTNDPSQENPGSSSTCTTLPKARPTSLSLPPAKRLAACRKPVPRGSVAKCAGLE